MNKCRPIKYKILISNVEIFITHTIQSAQNKIVKIKWQFLTQGVSVDSHKYSTSD